MLYPYNSPVIMTDDIFQAYGGELGSTLSEARQASYRISEQWVYEDLDTFLTPTIVTGTYSYSNTIQLDHTFVTKVHLLRFYDETERLYWTISGTANVYASLRDDGEYGLVDLHQVLANCQGCRTSHGILPYKIQIPYTAGLVSGSSYQPNILLGLTMLSKIVLNEIIGYGNESPGDAGVQKFSNQDYYEQRTYLLRTTFGSSAQANFVRRLLLPYRRNQYVGL